MAYSIKEVVDILLSSAEGKVLAFNMVHAVDNGILSFRKANEFITDWFEPYLIGDFDNLNTDSLKDLFYRTLSDGEVNSKNYLSATKIPRTTTNNKYKLFYSLKEYEKLYKYTLSGFGWENGDPLPDPDSTDLEIVIKNLNDDKKFEKNLIVASDKRFSLEDGVYWICPEQDLKSIIPSSDSATRARDFLGLAHIDEGSYIMAVEIPPSYIGNSKGDNVAVRPTPLDAGYHPRFKCLADRCFQKSHNRESGFTFDLAKQIKGESIADGGREFIVKERDATRVTSLKLTPLGKTTCGVDNSSLMIDDFIERLEKIGGISVSDLSNEFEALI